MVYYASQYGTNVHVHNKCFDIGRCKDAFVLLKELAAECIFRVTIPNTDVSIDTICSLFLTLVAEPISKLQINSATRHLSFTIQPMGVEP